MRFIHCADIHLDSPLRGLEFYDGAPAAEMRQATRREFANVVDLAIDRAADCVLIAGDQQNETPTVGNHEPAPNRASTCSTRSRVENGFVT